MFVAARSDAAAELSYTVHTISSATIEFYTKISDSSLALVTVLPLLSLLFFGTKQLLEGYVRAPLDKEQQRARDDEEEAAIKASATASSKLSS